MRIIEWDFVAWGIIASDREERKFFFRKNNLNLFNFFREKIEEKGIFDLLSSASTWRGNSTLKQRVSPLKQFFSPIRSSSVEFVTFEKTYNNLSSPNFSIRVTIYAQLLPSRFHSCFSCFYDFNDFQPDDSVKKGVSGIPRSRAFWEKFEFGTKEGRRRKVGCLATNFRFVRTRRVEGGINFEELISETISSAGKALLSRADKRNAPSSDLPSSLARALEEFERQSHLRPTSLPFLPLSGINVSPLSFSLSFSSFFFFFTPYLPLFSPG